MTALAHEYLHDELLRTELGNTLLAARKARYLSIDDVAATLNIMPCHIRLIENAQYNPASQEGIFLDLVEQYCRFADVRMAAPTSSAAAAKTSRQFSRTSRLDRAPSHSAAALTAAIMVLAVFLPMSKMAIDSEPAYERMTFYTPAVEVPAAEETLLKEYSEPDSLVAEMATEFAADAETPIPESMMQVAASDPLASSEKPQYAQLDVFEIEPSAGGVPQHDDDEALDQFSAAPATAVLEEPATYPASLDHDEFAVQEVSSFIEGLRSLADRS